MRTRMHNPEQETFSRDQLASLQTERLERVVRHVWEKNPLYRRRLQNAGVGPDDIKHLDDVVRLPVMSKEELRHTFPDALRCVEKRHIAEMHMSSGSTGSPIAMLYTKNDLAHWAECMARCYAMAGLNPGDPFQITTSFGLFNGGFGMYLGARARGLFIIPTGPGNTARQLSMAREFRARGLGAVVSYGIRLLEEIKKEGSRLPDLQVGVFGAETFSPAVKKAIEDGLGIEAFDIYGMTETGGIGTLGQDCPVHEGIHVWEDHNIVEVIDPQTRRPVADGEYGELTITTLLREALPVIRFRTGDRARIISREPCACGRTHLRIAAITGRLDDMLIIKGINFFPTQVEQALMEIPGVHPNYQIIIEEFEGVKDVKVLVEAEASVTGYTVQKHLKERLGFQPKGDVLPPGSLPRPEGKAKRVIHCKRGEDVETRPADRDVHGSR